MKHCRYQATRVALVVTLLLTGKPLRAQSDEEVRAATEVTAGFAVHLGTSDGRLEAELASEGRLLVQGLSLDAKTVATARQAVREARVYGFASINQVPSFRPLPYADNLVNLLIADMDALGTAAPQRAEIKRVLAPRGKAYLRESGKWTVTVKPVPEAMDEWTHWDYGPGGNPASQDELIKPTTSLRWYAGPSTAHSGGTKVGLRLTGGRVFYTALDYQIPRKGRGAKKSDLVARDAHNGVLLWTRPIDDVPGRGDNPPRFALTASDDRVYAVVEPGEPLHALNAANGETLRRFEQAPYPPAMNERNRDYWRSRAESLHFISRVFGDKLLTTQLSHIAVSDVNTGRRLWHVDVGEEKTVGWAVMGGGKVFCAVAKRQLVKFRASPVSELIAIIALDAEDGRELWRHTDLSGRLMFRMCYHDGRVLVPTFAQSEKKASYRHGNWAVSCLDAADGKPIWVNDQVSGGSTGGHYAIVLVKGDEVIVGQQSGFGLDLGTGKLTRKYDWGQHDNSCADLKCVPGYTMYGLTFINEQGERIVRGQSRSICDTGLFPAYGLLYSSPSACLCAEYINGYHALSADSSRDPMPEDKRLLKGEAYGTVRLATGRKPNAFPASNEWPMHMADPRRRSYSTTAVAGELKRKWSSQAVAWPVGYLARDWRDNEQIVGPISSPTVAEGKVFVAAPDAHQILAFDCQTGQAVWSFDTGARVDSPPTIFEGRCLFGCRDGWVYCLRAEDGQLVWRFFAGRCDKRITVQSQVESAWPLVGSVMIDDGAIVVAAGRQTALDGGIQIYKLDPHTGRAVWHTRLWTDPDVPRPTKWQWRNRRLNDLLVSNGSHVCLWVTELEKDYRDGREVDIFRRVFPARAVRFVQSEELKQRTEDLSKATWLWAANSNGLLSRRTEGVGRFDAAGVNYANLNAARIVIADRAVYALRAQGGTRDKPLRGDLIRIPLTGDGTLADAPTWTTNSAGRGVASAMIVAGDRIYIAMTNEEGGAPTLHVHATSNGSKLAEIDLHAPVVRDGLAAAYGNLYIASADGSIVCY